MAALDNEEVTALDLGHDTGKDAVDEGVEGRVADEVVGNVDEEAFVGANRGSQCLEDIVEGR